MTDHAFNATYVLANIGWPALFIAVCYYATHGWMRLAQWIEHRHPTARIITFPARSADVIELYPNERGSA